MSEEHSLNESAAEAHYPEPPIPESGPQDVPSGSPKVPESGSSSGTVRVTRHTRRNLIAVSVFLFVVIFFSASFKLAVVRGDSMLPTYHDGQMLLVSKVRALHGPLKRGDVILVEHGADVLIKRVAYLPGDAIPPEETFRFRRVMEFFDVVRPGPQDPPYPRLRVPDGYIVILGDNRRVSEDSRLFGPVKEADVLGRVLNSVPKP